MKENLIELVEFLNKKFPNNNFGIQELIKTFRITRSVYGNVSSYAFIAKVDTNTKSLGNVNKGDIFKCASWDKAAKHARGNLFNKETWNCFEEYGVISLK